MTDITLTITFSEDDIEVIERIVEEQGYHTDYTGILSHIVSEYQNSRQLLSEQQ